MEFKLVQSKRHQPNLLLHTFFGWDQLKPVQFHNTVTIYLHQHHRHYMEWLRSSCASCHPVQMNRMAYLLSYYFQLNVLKVWDRNVKQSTYICSAVVYSVESLESIYILNLICFLVGDSSYVICSIFMSAFLLLCMEMFTNWFTQRQRFLRFHRSSIFCCILINLAPDRTSA